jgi:hypothetical protein
MKARNTSNLSRIKALFISMVSILLLCITVLFIVQAQTVTSQEAADLPPQTGPLLDPETFATNVAIGDAGEKRDEQAFLDAQSRSDDPLFAKDGTSSPPTVPPSSIDPPWPVGLDDHPVPLAGWGTLYHITNSWSDSINDQRATVVAGSKADDPAAAIWNTPEQGVLIILGIPPTLNGEYLAPSRTGQLRITSANGTCLSLISTGNTSYEFDAATRQWTCAPANTQPPP